MVLKIYDKTIPVPHGGKSSNTRLCCVNGIYKYMSFNACAFRELGMKKGMRMIFAQDSDTGAWFFAFGDADKMKNGCMIQPVYRGGNIVNARVQNSIVIGKICSEVKSNSATFYISKHPKRMGGIEWYRIITTSPYRIEQ